MNGVKYQIFISSTYSDLRAERQMVTHRILDMGHIPAGMEMFPASDTEQLTYITKIIDECDYYILIVGARYGSLDAEGVSYTEREYDYAVASGKTVLVFIHANMDAIELGRTDKDQEKYQKLISFREKAVKNRLVQFWNDPSELAASVVISLSKAFSADPQTGWVRADSVLDQATLADALKVRSENDRLKEEIRNLREAVRPVFDDAAGVTDVFPLRYIYENRYGDRQGSLQLTYGNFLKLFAPVAHTPTTFPTIQFAVLRGVRERYELNHPQIRIADSVLQDALMHLVAIGLLKMWQSTAGTAHVTAYQLTEVGVKFWQETSYDRREAAANPAPSVSESTTV